MKLTRTKMTLLLVGAALLAACGSARVVQRTQYGGIIALEGDHGKAMEGAHAEMAAHCGAGNYTIVKEAEEVIGTDTTYGESSDYDSHGSSTSGGESTRQVTEMRVHYQCGGVPTGGSPGAPY
jgi:hypothetical protein